MKKQIGEWYAEYEENTGLYHIFHTDLYEGKAFYSFASQQEAERRADEMNEQQAAHNRQIEEGETQVYISNMLKEIPDKSIENILRKVIFFNTDVINWDIVRGLIKENRPETELEGF